MKYYDNFPNIFMNLAIIIVWLHWMGCVLRQLLSWAFGDVLSANKIESMVEQSIETRMIDDFFLKK